MKKMVAIIKKSSVEEFKKEAPEIFSMDEVEIKIEEDAEFDLMLRMMEKDLSHKE